MFSVYNSGDVWEIDTVPALGRNKLTSDGHVNSLLTKNLYCFRHGYLYFHITISSQFQLTVK